MKHSIVVDSCCDMTDEIKEQLNLKIVPLYLTLGSKQIIDENLDIPAFLKEMQACEEKVGSAAPSPHLYQQAFEASESSFAVTLSSRLSSSYSSALIGKDMLDDKNHDVYIFDSKSAAAGELLIAMKIQELMETGASKAEIIEEVEAFIKEMKTYFVLDNIDNLLKNGRLSRVKAGLIHILNIKPLMGSDGDGNIVHYGNCRGPSKIVKKMAEIVATSNRDTSGKTAVISHCNNESLAIKLKEQLEEQYQFKQIIIVPTGGVSSLYANEKGIILAY